jgi:histone-lysine N-methyltransferase SETMAR
VFTEANIELIRQLIEENRHSNYLELQRDSGINRFTIWEVILNALRMRKLASRWIPHKLSDQNRKERVEACQENLTKFQEGKWRLCDVITGDESWLYLRQIGHKSSNSVWIGEGQPPGIVVRRNRFEPKNMFAVSFKTTGIAFIDHKEKGSTIAAKYNIENSLKPVIERMSQLRKKSGSKNLKILQDNAKPHVTKTVTEHRPDQTGT